MLFEIICIGGFSYVWVACNLDWKKICAKFRKVCKCAKLLIFEFPILRKIKKEILKNLKVDPKTVLLMLIKQTLLI